MSNVVTLYLLLYLSFLYVPTPHTPHARSSHYIRFFFFVPSFFVCPILQIDVCIYLWCIEPRVLAGPQTTTVVYTTKAVAQRNPFLPLYLAAVPSAN
jgi:hypothetical protein